MASLFSRALAGAGKEAGVLANQYITEELAQGRARLHAELQRTTASAMRNDQFAFENDPANVLRSNETGRQRALSQAAATREADLAGLTDQPYRAAKQAAADEDFAAETSRKIVGRKAELTELTPAEIAAADAKIRGTTAAEAARAGAIADAGARSQARYRETPPSVAKKVAEFETVLGRTLTEQEKASVLGLITKEPEKYTAMPIKEADGSISGYQAFDTRRGTFVREAPKGPATEQEAHAQAQTAIAAGADPAAVNARLQQSGFTPIGGQKVDKPKPRPLMERGAERAPRSTAMDAEIQQAMQPVRPDRAGFAERQANKAKADADPDLQALDRRRAELLRAGKARDANAVIDQMNQLRRERYGF